MERGEPARTVWVQDEAFGLASAGLAEDDHKEIWLRNGFKITSTISLVNRLGPHADTVRYVINDLFPEGGDL